MNRRKIKYYYTVYNESGLGETYHEEGYLLDFTISSYNGCDNINIKPLAIVETKIGTIKLISLTNIEFVDKKRNNKWIK